MTKAEIKVFSKVVLKEFRSNCLPTSKIGSSESRNFGSRRLNCFFWISHLVLRKD